MRSAHRLVAPLLVVLLAATVAAGCGDDEPSEPVEFGQGEIPDSFPDDFPIPGGATIGSTLVDRVNHRTEVALGIRGDLEATIQYFTFQLVEAGYVVESSEGSPALWLITFSKGDLEGEITLSPSSASATQVVASVNRS